MVASRIVELPKDLVEEIDARCLADVREDLPSRIPINVTEWNPRKILCNGGSSETLRLISVRGRRRRRNETASQSSGLEFVFTDLGSFGRRRRAHQIWFHLSAPWWKPRDNSVDGRFEGFSGGSVQDMNTPARDTSESDKGAVDVHWRRGFVPLVFSPSISLSFSLRLGIDVLCLFSVT
ncbi:hypothetical protein F2Q68_00006713 [Brassica cretica]|uniref:Uncharacterized protein n=1 Tax=Brassica cretica TaxID=69181 RepID=A0A8S9JMH2_BRACR|nr:hypothetical protein F2Q68_00006713 [Brassica cretica]